MALKLPNLSLKVLGRPNGGPLEAKVFLKFTQSKILDTLYIEFVFVD